MIAFLAGTVQKKLDKKIIVNVQGVGYLVTIPGGMFETLHEGKPIELFVHTSVREDDISLYGLPSADAIAFFNQLISVQGIGPKLATDILSLPIDATKNAIVAGNVAKLTSIPGIGKRIAERIITELKDKIDMIGVENMSQSFKGSLKKENEEATEALIGLGYQRSEIMRKLKNIPEDLRKTEDIVRFFLQGA